MPISKGYKQLVAEAESQVVALTPLQVDAKLQTPGVLLVDLRDVREVKREGKIPGALHVPRGMLEFWIDPDSPYHKPVFAQDKRYVFFCAGGMRSALAAKTAHDLGLKPVAHIEGGFGAWKKAGGMVDDGSK